MTPAFIRRIPVPAQPTVCGYDHRDDMLEAHYLVRCAEERA